MQKQHLWGATMRMDSTHAKHWGLCDCSHRTCMYIYCSNWLVYQTRKYLIVAVSVCKLISNYHLLTFMSNDLKVEMIVTVDCRCLYRSNCLNRYLSVLGLINSPKCGNCNEADETALHYLCYCSHYDAVRTRIWGKPFLHPSKVLYITVRDLLGFLTSSRYQGLYWGMDYGPVHSLVLRRTTSSPPKRELDLELVLTNCEYGLVRDV